MAKIKHNNFIDTVDEVITSAKERNILHLYAQNTTMDGRHLTINGIDTLHFGTCGYLSLEHHAKVKEGAIRAIEQYGTQFPMSKTYISNPLYTELEALIEQMYQAPVVISKNCTISHLATIPVIVREEDAVILDHQVHASVQEAVQKMLVKGVKVEMIRHNNLDMLEDKIIALRKKHQRIWYMSDGVYSMYGDFAPINKLTALADKYPELYLYVDDAHGMSWAGQHGTGYIMSQMGKLHEKMILTATLGKAFGACGGVSVFPNAEWQRKVKNFGGPNTFSVQLEPPILGAAIASAKIHLSDEIYPMQEELQKRITYCNALINKTDLPLVAQTNSPVFYIGTGVLGMTNLFVERLIKDGIYINPAIFPAVPAKNNGARFTISLNNSFEDIEKLVDKMNEHFEQCLIETNQSQDKIRKAFRMPAIDKVNQDLPKDSLELEVLHSIKSIEKKEWDKYVGHSGMFDWNGMKYLEASFSGNDKPEDNWDFRYIKIRDSKGEIILFTFAIIGIYKEDTFSKASISKQIEEVRLTDPYYLTSKAVMLGSMFTEGDHMYIDRNHSQWSEALRTLVETLYSEQEKSDASNVVIRDFKSEDKELNDFLRDMGFIKVDMPESCVLENLSWSTEDEYKKTLSKSGRKHFREEVKKYENHYLVEVKDILLEHELEHTWNLFTNVKAKNYGLNTFAPPKKAFYEMNADKNWEFIILRMNPAISDHKEPVAVVMCHKNSHDIYSVMLIGMDYDFVYPYRGYLQALYQTILRAKALDCKKANFGISATTEKKKLGVSVIPKVAYFHANDNFALEVLSRTMVVTEK